MGGWKPSETLKWDHATRWTKRGEAITSLWDHIDDWRNVQLLDQNCAIDPNRSLPVEIGFKTDFVELYEWLRTRTHDVRGGVATEDLPSKAQEAQAAYVWHTFRKQVWALSKTASNAKELSAATAINELKELLEEMRNGIDLGTGARQRIDGKQKGRQGKQKEVNTSVLGGKRHASGLRPPVNRSAVLSTRSEGREQRQEQDEELTPADIACALELAVAQANARTWSSAEPGDLLTDGLARLHLFSRLNDLELGPAAFPAKNIALAPPSFLPISMRDLADTIERFIASPPETPINPFERYRGSKTKRKLVETASPNSTERVAKKAKAPVCTHNEIIAANSPDGGAGGAEDTAPFLGEVDEIHLRDDVLAELVEQGKALCTDPWRTLVVMNAGFSLSTEVRKALNASVAEGMFSAGRVAEETSNEHARQLIYDMDRLTMVYSKPDDSL
ncbi:hypothetical protein FRB90_006482 [Tulasnella sp. 427]|nr:hypothetical protein FRB90_006482 [Tulasnella sp. 427]